MAYRGTTVLRWFGGASMIENLSRARRGSKVQFELTVQTKQAVGGGGGWSADEWKKKIKLQCAWSRKRKLRYIGTFQTIFVRV